MTSVIKFLVERGLVVNLVSIFLFAVGLVVSVMFLQIEAFPNVNLDLIQINTAYPAASPKEIEQLVITPIEQELRALNGIDKMISMAFPGSGRITLEVDPNANNRDRLASEVSLAVDRADLPNDLPNRPSVTEVDGSVFPVIRLAVSAPMNELELKRLGDSLKDDLLTINGVARVVILGNRKAEYRVVVDQKKMASARIAVGEIAIALQKWNLNTPGGEVDTEEGQKSVRIVGQFYGTEDAGNLVLRSNFRGDVLRLKDVATVTESLEKPVTLHDVGGRPGL
ncbi:MAG: efflux RND transporter permease subunit, partial [Gammaproteobacteria bacterium]|nr:efflux RND transporter permease subunit [Gammaproteobacteria bacterium]